MFLFPSSPQPLERRLFRFSSCPLMSGEETRLSPPILSFHLFVIYIEARSGPQSLIFSRRRVHLPPRPFRSLALPRDLRQTLPFSILPVFLSLPNTALFPRSLHGSLLCPSTVLFESSHLMVIQFVFLVSVLRRSLNLVDPDCLWPFLPISPPFFSLSSPEPIFSFCC